MSLVLVVAASAAVGLYVDAQVPYFPIEISRMIAGPRARLFFLVAFCVFFIIERRWVTRNLLVSLGVFTLGYYSDQYSWALHMTGVAIMAVGFLASAWSNGRLLWLAGAALLWSARVALKLAVLVWRTGTLNPITLFHTFKHIMYTGDTGGDALVLLVFKACGALQWVALAICYYTTVKK